MTRDEQRKACIEAMARAISECNDAPWTAFIDDATAAFDALHSIARVCPVEATEEMLRAALPISSDPELWRAMSAAGDLTNPQETKP